MDILILSIATAFIAFTISETKLFTKFRNAIIARNSFFGELVSCGYCLSFWIALFFVLNYKIFVIFSNLIVIDIFVSTAIIAWLSAIQWALLNYLMIKIGK